MGKRLIVPNVDFSQNAIGREMTFVLSNGYATENNIYVQVDTNSASNAIRVRTNQLTGSYKVTTNPGYVIRAIVTYATPINIEGSGNYKSTDVALVQNVQGVTSYTLSNEGKYSIVTFCKENDNAKLLSTEDIVQRIEKLE